MEIRKVCELSEAGRGRVNTIVAHRNWVETLEKLGYTSVKDADSLLGPPVQLQLKWKSEPWKQVHPNIGALYGS